MVIRTRVECWECLGSREVDGMECPTCYGAGEVVNDDDGNPDGLDDEPDDYPR